MSRADQVRRGRAAHHRVRHRFRQRRLLCSLRNIPSALLVGQGERRLWCPDVEPGPALYRVFQAWVAGTAGSALTVVPGAEKKSHAFGPRRTTGSRGVACGDDLDPLSMALRYTWKGAFRISWMTRPTRLRQTLQRDKDTIESLGLDRWPPPAWHAFPVTFEDVVPAAEPAAVLPARPSGRPETEGLDGDQRPPDTNSA